MVSLLLLLALCTEFVIFLMVWQPLTADAAVVTVSNTANSRGNSHIVAGSQTVFVSDAVGYRFYRASPDNGPCVYRKTTDGGTTWGGQVTVDSRTDCINMSVWYDGWTPGDTGTAIHIGTMNSFSTIDDLFYNRLETATDSLLNGSNPTNVSSSSGQVGTFSLGVNNHTITKGTDGTIYMAVSDAQDSFVVSCGSNCDQESSWSETGAPFLDTANDWNVLVPLLSGDVMLINRQITSPQNIRSRIWNGTSWSGSWSVIESGVDRSTTYDVGMAATVHPTSGEVYLVYGADHNNYTVLDHDVRTAKYSGSSWTLTSDVITNDPVRGLHDVAVSLDVNTDTVYAVYSMRSDPNDSTSADVYYATSTAAMTSWGTEQGPINVSSANIYGLDTNLLSNERIYATWFDFGASSIFGETIATLAPPTTVTTAGNQVDSKEAGAINAHLGGAFVIKESQVSRDLTSITISESGTIDAATNLSNVKLLYDLDTTAPYDCSSESYTGTESQFGSTATAGFSAPNGTVTFTDSLTITPTQTVCLYVVTDIASDVADGQTAAFFINDPTVDVTLTGSGGIIPDTPVTFFTDTTIVNSILTQTNYHWRNNDGSEVGATSATGGTENTPLSAVLPNEPIRFRVGVSNDGSTSSQAATYTLEYAVSASTCDLATGWLDVGAVADEWNMFDSSFLSEGANTTNIATTTGGISDTNTTFLTPNGGVRDTTSQTAPLVLSDTEFLELEFSIVASTSVTEGETYCFRVTDDGVPLLNYNNYPTATVSADATLNSIGELADTVVVATANQYSGGAFVLRENANTRNITAITVTHTGTAEADVALENVKLRYEFDTTAPYDCASESYGGAEAQFGSTVTGGFSAPNGTVTFSDSVSISTSSALCLYLEYDTTALAETGTSLQFAVNDPPTDITLSSGSISPTSAVAITGSSTIIGAEVVQTGYHWRNDDGDEVSATSATGEEENALLAGHAQNRPIRLRFGVANVGSASTSPQTFRLEYATKISTCEVASGWTDVAAAADAWDLHASSFLVHGNNTTNISIASGGVTDGAASFLADNSGQRVTSSETTPLVLAADAFTEIEYSLTSTNLTATDLTYCFRLTNAGTALSNYSQYPQIQTSPKRDYIIQRGVSEVSGSGLTLTAGVDYAAPTNNNRAFVRITDLHHTGAGKTAGGGVQNARDVTAYISAASNLTSGFTISRPSTAIDNTRVAWEIVEFVGGAGTDNEMVVRDVGTVSVATGNSVATGTSVLGVQDNSRVVVYITGIESSSASRNFYYASQFTSLWDDTSQSPVFNRGGNDADIRLSYAVVEYTGFNWAIQRVEHTYNDVGVIETESMTAVNSLARTFSHIQKRMNALGNVANFGHEVWLSSIGAVSFRLASDADTPAGHTSVVWVIENKQTSEGAMKVSRSSNATTGGIEPVTTVVGLFSPVEDLANTSIFGVGRGSGANVAFPRSHAGLRLTSTSTYEVWRSDADTTLTFRAEVVEWPITGLAVRQNYYRFYTENEQLTPTDPWPPGEVDIGENTSITINDAPLGGADTIRLRMSLQVANANLPSNLYDFKLQYGERLSTCSAITTWSDVGVPNSGEIWRGFATTSISNNTVLSGDPPTMGDLLLSVSDTAGHYVNASSSLTNPYNVSPGDDIEYDWSLQHNGAAPRTTYCFRMVRADATPLDGYLNYPQLLTAGFTPASQVWRWYSDATSETPTMPLADEDTAPTEIASGDLVALRVAVAEQKGVAGDDIKFSLQFDESPSFTNPRNVAATSTCTATSTWCYTEAGQVDNQTISTALLSGSDACTTGSGVGCGTHNTSPLYASGDTHAANVNREYAFYLVPVMARVGAVYYFRLYNILDDEVVTVQSGNSYPSLVAASGQLSLTVTGLEAGTTTASVVVDTTSFSDSISFASIPINTEYHAAHRISVSTNATEGYRVLASARQPLRNNSGTELAHISSTNAAPTAWDEACNAASSTGCFGYHTTDATLSGNSSRFVADDSYAGLSTVPAEIMYSPVPISDTHDIIYKIWVSQLQPAGTYETEIVYQVIPTF